MVNSKKLSSHQLKLSGLNQIRAKVYNDLDKSLGKFFVRQMATFAKNYQPRIFNLILQLLAIVQGHLGIVFSPQQESRLTN